MVGPRIQRVSSIQAVPKRTLSCWCLGTRGMNDPYKPSNFRGWFPLRGPKPLGSFHFSFPTSRTDPKLSIQVTCSWPRLEVDPAGRRGNPFVGKCLTWLWPSRGSLLGCWVVGSWAVGFLGCWVLGLLGSWVVGLLGLGCWVRLALLGYWVVGRDQHSLSIVCNPG